MVDNGRNVLGGARPMQLKSDKCVGERQGMCVGKQRMCVWDAKGGRAQREEERVRRECRERKCVGERQGMCVLGSEGCVCVGLPRRKSA